jgi:hypothetical protein
MDGVTVPADDPVVEVISVDIEVVPDNPADDFGHTAEFVAGRLVAAADLSNGTHDPDLAEFTRLDNIVVAGAKAFFEAGSALLQIREKSLWRAGGHASWNAYCEEARGFTRQHVNRLIKAVPVMAAIQTVEPIGSTSVATRPQSEAQVRELTRLRDPASQVAAWTRAVDDANGQQPTAARLRDVVAAMMAEVDSMPTKKPKRRTELDVTIAELRAEIEGKLDRDRLRGLLDVIEKLRSCQS